MYVESWIGPWFTVRYGGPSMMFTSLQVTTVQYWNIIRIVYRHNKHKSIMNLLQYTFPTFIYCIFLCIYSRNAQDMSDRIDTSRAIAWIIGVLTIGNTPSRNYALMDAILACINWGNVYADKKESLFPKRGQGCRGSRTLWSPSPLCFSHRSLLTSKTVCSTKCEHH